VARPTRWPWSSANGADRHRGIRPHRACKETAFHERPTNPRFLATPATADKVSRATLSRATPVEAAFAYAATVHFPDRPFELGFYQWISREPAPGTPSGIHGARLKLDKDQITAGKYRLYELGEITVTPDSWIWFSAKSWVTHLEVGTRVWEPGAANIWHAWVSIKFDGPSYGGTAKEDLVLVDRIILVKKIANQFQTP
jgi:hypothetical protein